MMKEKRQLNEEIDFTKPPMSDQERNDKWWDLHNATDEFARLAGMAEKSKFSDVLEAHTKLSAILDELNIDGGRRVIADTKTHSPKEFEAKYRL